MLIDVVKFRFKRAFRRFGRIWGGYSEALHLESSCYSPREIREAFGEHFEITCRRGYSIIFPAWYRVRWALRMGRKASDLLWDADRILNRTPAWCLGEYALYSFRIRQTGGAE